jgi:hypothetical protein
VRFPLGEELPPALAGRRFGAISAMDVVFHILDDAAYHRTLATLHALLGPGGLLVFAENFLHGVEQRSAHQRSCTLAEIERAVREAGFEILHRRPLFFLMNAPHDTRSRLHHVWWRLPAGAASRSAQLGNLPDAALYLPKRVLTARLRVGPSTEFMLCRRPPRVPVEVTGVERRLVRAGRGQDGVAQGVRAQFDIGTRGERRELSGGERLDARGRREERTRLAEQPWADTERAGHAEVGQQRRQPVRGAVVEGQRAQAVRPLQRPGELGHGHERVAVCLQRPHLRPEGIGRDRQMVQVVRGVDRAYQV